MTIQSFIQQQGQSPVGLYAVNRDFIYHLTNMEQKILKHNKQVSWHADKVTTQSFLGYKDNNNRN